MTMSNHIFSLCKTLNFHLRNLVRVRMFIDETTCHHLIRALITSRLDYAKSLLKGSSGKKIYRLQRLQNRAAKLIFMAKKSDHVSTSLNNFTGFLFINLLIFKLCYFLMLQRLRTFIIMLKNFSTKLQWTSLQFRFPDVNKAKN